MNIILFVDFSKGGASKSESWRSSIDSLLIKIATNSCKGGWGNEENNIFLPHESTSIWTDFQLSSLRALLASLLAPTRVRPPYLSQGLELFRKGNYFLHDNIVSHFDFFFYEKKHCYDNILCSLR